MMHGPLNVKSMHLINTENMKHVRVVLLTYEGYLGCWPVAHGAATHGSPQLSGPRRATEIGH